MCGISGHAFFLDLKNYIYIPSIYLEPAVIYQIYTCAWRLKGICFQLKPGYYLVIYGSYQGKAQQKKINK